MTLTHQDIKKAFPFFSAHPEIVYLDTAATSQKPSCVIDAMSRYYATNNATVHRAAYSLSYETTALYEQARENIAAFIGSNSDQLIFTKGATESLNLIASGLRRSISSQDEIIVCETEHHANLLPWQRLAQEKGAKLIKLPVDEAGRINPEVLNSLLNENTKIVALAHMSNVTGVIQDLKTLSHLVHKTNAFFIVDGAQGVLHEAIDVSDLQLDAYVFSSHKIYGPTGLGICYLSQRLMDFIDLYQVGGDVIEHVSFEHTTYRKGRFRFEAGTPMIAEVIGFNAAISFLKSLDLHLLYQEEKRLILQIKQALRQMPGMHLIGDSDAGLVSFYSDHVHALDLATFLDSRHIAMRSGHLCAQTCLSRFHTKHAVRMSLGIYTDQQDIDKALRVLEEAVLFFN